MTDQTGTKAGHELEARPSTKNARKYLLALAIALVITLVVWCGFYHHKGIFRKGVNTWDCFTVSERPKE
jgi:hypothetical protein